jgi:hypothetical protein
MLSGDLTLEAFMSLTEKMNASAPNETTAIENLVYGSQQAYDQKLIDEYEAAGVRPHMVWPQLFNGQDALDSIDNTKYGTQARF